MHRLQCAFNAAYWNADDNYPRVMRKKSLVLIARPRVATSRDCGDEFLISLQKAETDRCLGLEMTLESAPPQKFVNVINHSMRIKPRTFWFKTF